MMLSRLHKMTSTADAIKSKLSSDPKYWTRNGTQYNGIAPSEIRAGSDGQSFSVEFSGDEHGRYKDFKGNGGSLYTLAKLLSIPLPELAPSRYSRKAKTLSDYEQDKYLPEGRLAAKGWSEGEHMDRPCIFIPAADGTTQVRFLDEKEPRYFWKEKREGKALPFYGTRAALAMASDSEIDFIALVNGAGSVEACQRYGIPAFCVLGGEKAFSKAHADLILSKFKGSVLVALDSDTAGQAASESACNLLGERAIEIDFQGADKFDAADFVALWQEQSLQELKRLSKHSEYLKTPTNAHEALQASIDTINGLRPMQGRIVPQPFNLLHQFGGGARWLEPDRLTGVVGLSGGGKTSFWHSLIMKLIHHPRRFGFIVDGREFSAESDNMRRVQMVTGDAALSYDAITAHKVAVQEASESYAKYAQDGKRMPDSDVKKLEKLNAENQSEWQGHIEYATEYSYIEDTLDYMKRRTIELRSQGTHIDVWIFDYLTLYKAKQETLAGKDGIIANTILEIIKAASRSVHVHSIVMMQPNKTPSGEQLAKNELLKVTDIGYANANHFNLILGLNTIYGKEAFRKDDGTYTTKQGTNGKWIMGKSQLQDGSYAAVIEVLKTTFGRTGYVRIKADLPNLQWKDEIWHGGDLRIAPSDDL